jgi:hypothetical protein
MNLSEKAKVFMASSDKFFEVDCESAQHGAICFILHITKGGMKHGKFSY